LCDTAFQLSFFAPDGETGQDCLLELVFFLAIVVFCSLVIADAAAAGRQAG
jgi:hypothetical protein